MSARRAFERQRLVNRAAGFTLLAALLALIGTMTAATAFEHSRSAAVRAASTAPLAAAAGAALWARSARAQLRRADADERIEAELADSVPAPPGATAIEEERPASTDLRAIG